MESVGSSDSNGTLLILSHSGQRNKEQSVYLSTIPRGRCRGTRKTPSGCRAFGLTDLRSAQNELRWIAEHVKETQKSPRYFLQCVRRRARGEPLQYILGSEYFGSVEIKCRPGVLIPRPDTASGLTHLVHRLDTSQLLKTGRGGVRLIDICSGSGCIPILFHNEFYARSGLSQLPLDLIGVDISHHAIRLARENQALQLRDTIDGHISTTRYRSLTSCKFVLDDVLGSVDSQQNFKAVLNDHARSDSVTIMTANPPYISSKAFLHTTARSVRRFEPKLALVPEVAPGADVVDGDAFYPRLIGIAQAMRAAVLWFEVADLEQARRVAQMVLKARDWDRVEIWRDEPDASKRQTESFQIEGQEIPVCGQGEGRSVFAYILGSHLIVSPKIQP